MEKKIQNQLRSLKLYNAFLTLIIFCLIFLSFKDSNKNKFDEISVERLNVIDKDGNLTMVIGSKGKLPGSTMNGKEFSKQQRGSGMIFYNEDGDECGGYQWGSDKDGSAGAIFAFDQYKQDQIVSLIYQETSGNLGDPTKKRYAGLSVNPQPTNIALDVLLAKYETARKIQDSTLKATTLNTLNNYYNSTSLFAGKRRNDDMGVFISDANLNTRLKLYADKNGNPKLEFLDSSGKVIYSLPPSQ